MCMFVGLTQKLQLFPEVEKEKIESRRILLINNHPIQFFRVDGFVKCKTIIPFVIKYLQSHRQLICVTP